MHTPLKGTETHNSFLHLFKNINDDLLYLGNYFFSNRSLFLGIGPIIVKGNGVGYNLYDAMNGNYVMEIDDNKVYEKKIDLKTFSSPEKPTNSMLTLILLLSAHTSHTLSVNATETYSSGFFNDQ